MEGEHCVTALTRLVFHPGLLDEDSSEQTTILNWSTDQDRALTEAVRKHQFDFCAAAEEISELNSCNAADCRRRWAELDHAACEELNTRLEASAKTMAPQPSITPSGFSIFEDSVGERISTIFSNVRASLPTISLSDDDSESGDSISNEEDLATENAFDPPAGGAVRVEESTSGMSQVLARNSTLRTAEPRPNQRVRPVLRREHPAMVRERHGQKATLAVMSRW